MKLLCVVALVCVRRILGHTQPTMYWSMDTYVGTVLQPDICNSTEFDSCDTLSFDADNYVTSGIIGNALSVSKKSIKFVRNIDRKDCIRNPGVCANGLSVTFWAYIEEYTYKSFQVLIRTTTSARELPGFYIGGIDGDQTVLQFLVTTRQGKSYHATILRSLTYQKWTHYGFTWSEDGALKVYLNGTELTDDDFVSPPTIDDVGSRWPLLVDMVIGSSVGPIFSIDELRIYSRSVAQEEMASLYDLGSPIQSTVAVTTEMRSEIATTSVSITTIPTTTPKQTTQQKQTLATQTSATTKQLPTTTTSTPIMTTRPATASSRKPTTQATILNSTTMTSHTAFVIVGNVTVQLKNDSLATSLYPATDAPVPPVAEFTPFYLQPWFFVVIGGSMLALIATCVAMCIFYCCCGGDDEEEKVDGENAEVLLDKEGFATAEA